MTDVSLTSLSLVNFLVADMQTGFGAFISVHLTAKGWDTAQIGAVLSAGTIVSVVAQVPAGLVVDNSPNKRLVAAGAVVISMIALVLLAAAPGFWVVLLAMMFAGVSGPAQGLAIAAITLALTRQEQLGERLGQNARYAAIGAAVGAGILGLIGTSVSDAAVFLVAAAVGVPTLWALFRIRRADLNTAHQRTSHHTAPPPRARRSPPVRIPRLLRDRRLLAFLACCVAFQLVNASLLPLAAAEAARRAGGLADIITGAATVVPQVLVAVISPLVGRLAGRHGRRLLLLVGFAALPARALFFACDGSGDWLVLGQAFDGIGGAVFGVLTPLVVADITHRGGRFNLALGMVGVSVAVGASISNLAAGAVANAIGLPAAFLVLTAMGVGATALVWLIMPETAHLPAAMPTPPVAATAPVKLEPQR